MRLRLLKKFVKNVYGHDAVSVHVAQSWFKHFQSGNFYVKDAPCSDPSIIVDEIMEKVEQDRHIISIISSTYDSKKLNIDYKTVKPLRES